jgi:hypothetical protein
MSFRFCSCKKNITISITFSGHETPKIYQGIHSQETLHQKRCDWSQEDMFALLTYAGKRSLHNQSFTQIWMLMYSLLKMHFQKKKWFINAFQIEKEGQNKTCSLGLSRYLLWVAAFIHGWEQFNSEDDTVSLQNKQKFNILYRKSS